MDALNARDFETLADLSFYHPEGEFHSLLAGVEGEVYVGGVEGLRKWAEDVDATWENFHAEVLEIHELGDEQAVVVFRATGRAKASGIPLDWRVAQVWTWREGKLWRNVSYTDPSEALRPSDCGIKRHRGRTSKRSLRASTRSMLAIERRRLR
jgi:ketosteroid isomerase-like protein